MGYFLSGLRRLVIFLAGFEGGLFFEGGFEGAGELVGAGGAFTAALDAFAAGNYVGDFHAAGERADALCVAVATAKE